VGSNWVAVSLLLVEWAIRVALVLRIIMIRRPVPVALAWVLVVVWVPILGILVYLLVGENRLGRRRVRRFEELTAGMDRKAVALWQHRSEGMDQPLERYDQVANIAFAVGGFPPLKGNRLTLMTDAEATLEHIIRDIENAKSHVHMLYYLWMRGGMGVAVGEALVRAAGRGVQCRVLVDAVGSRPFLRSAMAARLRARGVQVVPALPVSLLRLPFYRLDLRNHRKLTVIDGRIAYSGSQNINDSTFRSNRRIRTGPWIDASLRIEGPAAQALGVVFLMDWQLDAGENMADLEAYLPDLGRPAHTESVVQVVPSGPGTAAASPGGPAGGIQQAILTAIYAAREELIMTSPYFVPDEATKAALISAAMRGVEVTIIVPARNDSPLVALASRSHLQDFLDAGVRVALYRHGLLHAKTLTVDRRIAIVGSANLDARSFYLNFEVTMFIYDDDFSSVVRFMQTGYLDASIELSPQEWRKRPALTRFAENTVRLMGPLL